LSFTHCETSAYKREREPTQHTLGGAAPWGVILAHVEEFTGERHLVLGEREVGAQPPPYSVEVARQAVATRLQALDLAVCVGTCPAQLCAPFEDRLLPRLDVTAEAAQSGPLNDR